MTEISFFTGTLVILAAWLLTRTVCCLKAGAVGWKQEAKQLLFLINLIVVLRFTFYPFFKVNGQIQPLVFDPATAWPFRINWIPFVNILDYESSLKDILINIPGNIAMFLPTGILLPLIYQNMDSPKKVVLTGAAISLGIEILQLPFSSRVSDIDDLILNTTGCLLGYGILALIRRIRKKQT